MLSLPVFVVVGEQFVTYIEAFKPYLLEALKNKAEYQVITVCSFPFEGQFQ